MSWRETEALLSRKQGWRRFILAALLVSAVPMVLLGCREGILHDLSEIEANRILAHLHDRNMTAAKLRQADGKWTVSVDRAAALDAIHLIGREKLVTEISGKEKPEGFSLISSRESQRFSYERGLSGEVETTLRSIEGVLSARVHLNLPRADPVLGSKEAGGTGSVLLVVDQRFTETKESIASIVGGASGVVPSAVSVLVTEQGQDFRQEEGESVPVSIGVLRSLKEDVLAAAFLIMSGMLLLYAAFRRSGRKGGVKC